MNLSLPESVSDLAGLLGYVDTLPAGMVPLDLDQGFAALLQRNPKVETEAGRSWRDEVAAFVMKLLAEPGKPWGLPYAPAQHKLCEDGTLETFPDLTTLGSETLAYWRHRARTTRNPGLRARYADLSWVFAKTFGERPDRADALIALEAFHDFVQAVPPEKEFDAIRAGQRAMALALSLRDEAWQLKAKQALFDLARALESQPFPLYRSFLLDCFGLGPFSKVELLPPELGYMTWLLEDQLERERANATPLEAPGIWYAENASQLLLAYYHQTGRDADVSRVLEAFAQVVHSRALVGAPMAGQAWLGTLSRLCLEFGRRDLSTLALASLNALGPKAVKSLKRISVTSEISDEEVRALTSPFTSGDLAQGLRRLAGLMAPKAEQVLKDTQKCASEFPLRFLTDTILMDGSGRPAVVVPAFHSNQAAYLPHAISERIQYDGFVRSLAIRAIRDRFDPTAEEIADYIQNSPAFQPERRELLLHGLRAYLLGDWVTAIHVLVPQIEEAARTFAGCMGESIFKWELEPDGVRRLDARSLNQVLDNPGFGGVLGPDHAAFLRVTLVRCQGLNLRNRIAHGLMLPSEFTESMADIVFQCLLTLGNIRAKEQEVGQ